RRASRPQRWSCNTPLRIRACVDMVSDPRNWRSTTRTLAPARARRRAVAAPACNDDIIVRLESGHCGSLETWLGGGAGEIGAHVRGEIRRIVPGAVDEGGLAPPHERQPHDVHARRGTNAARVAQAALVIEDGHVQPGIVGAKAGRPDYRLDPHRTEIELEPMAVGNVRRLIAARRV